ncbi:MAG TPA: ADP-forming succinate--CoA ligase subunit beta [Vicinamibacteria bacterium]|nr:ADP-forming succinate--CoA ligase subunit beta [Vicinamibacteria bacterium]
MNLHEYQAKELLARYQVKVPRGRKVESVAEAVEAAESLGYPVVVKAQIHAGGRGKAGGVKLARSRAEVEKFAGEILGKKLVTPQTGPEGKEVRKLLVEEGVNIDRELYLSFLIDRAIGWPIAIASQAGGMEIEKVAAETPEKILRAEIDPAVGMRPHQARRLAFELGLSGDVHKNAVRFLLSLYQAFRSIDASLVEINPLLVTREKEVMALDAKVSLDDNALFRHPDVKELRDLTEESPLEVEASKFSLNYIKLDGNVGCMVNGAGLAMATMDIIHHAGGAPANFLDVGGGASPEQVRNAFRILISDPQVKAVLINIFGGILRVDRLAEGVIAAVKELDVKVPVVIRAEGTNVDIGKKMLAESGLNFITADSMKEAAEKAVAAARGAQ